jgi:hypothetical protein
MQSDVLNMLNSKFPTIRFTVELEESCRLPFLDIDLARQADGAISTGVYRKATHTDRYLDFRSSHVSSSKASVVSCLMKRAASYPSDHDCRDAEMKKTKAVLAANNYPTWFIERHSNRQRRETASSGDEASNEDKKDTFLSSLSSQKSAISLPA